MIDVMAGIGLLTVIGGAMLGVCWVYWKVDTFLCGLKTMKFDIHCLKETLARKAPQIDQDEPKTKTKPRARGTAPEGS